jgi:hypothetical protein
LFCIPLIARVSEGVVAQRIKEGLRGRGLLPSSTLLVEREKIFILYVRLFG